MLNRHREDGLGNEGEAAGGMAWASWPEQFSSQVSTVGCPRLHLKLLLLKEESGNHNSLTGENATALMKTCGICY